jgi:hypothetical protein
VEIIPQLIAANSYVIYAVLGLATAYFLFVALAASREWRRSHFRLERISARGRMVGSIFRAIACVLLGAGVFFISTLAPATTEVSSRATAGATGTFVLPTSLPTARFTPTVIFATPVGGALPSTLSIITQTAPNGSVVVSIITTTVSAPTPTIIISATTTNTQLPTVAPIRPSPPPLPTLIPPTPVLVNCANPRAQIFSITNEAGPRIYTVRGNAQVEPDGYFKIEIILSEREQWSFLVRSTDSITAGTLLNNYNFGSFPAGNYPLRLVMVRGDGNISAMCETTLTLT